VRDAEGATDSPLRLGRDPQPVDDAAIVGYRDALELALPAPVREVVQREFDGLIACLVSLRALRDRLVARHRGRVTARM